MMMMKMMGPSWKWSLVPTAFMALMPSPGAPLPQPRVDGSLFLQIESGCASVRVEGSPEGAFEMLCDNKPPMTLYSYDGSNFKFTVLNGFPQTWAPLSHTAHPAYGQLFEVSKKDGHNLVISPDNCVRQWGTEAGRSNSQEPYGHCPPPSYEGPDVVNPYWQKRKLELPDKADAEDLNIEASSPSSPPEFPLPYFNSPDTKISELASEPPFNIFTDTQMGSLSEFAPEPAFITSPDTKIGSSVDPPLVAFNDFGVGVGTLDAENPWTG